MKYRLIDAEKPHHAVSRLARTLGVSRSGYHAWKRRRPSARSLSRRRASPSASRRSTRPSRGIYGAPRLQAELADDHAHPRGQEARRPPDARAGHPQGSRAQAPAQGQAQRPGGAGGAATSSPRVHGRGARPALGRRHHLRAPPGRAGSTSPWSWTPSAASDRRLVDARRPAGRARRRRASAWR